MQNTNGISRVLAFFILIFEIHSCKENEQVLPTIITASVTEIFSTTAISGGIVSSDGGTPIVLRGVCWNTAVNPTIDNSKTNEGVGSGSFTSNIIQLSPNTLYYLRAYATNNIGTAYGNQESFTTLFPDNRTGTVMDVEGNIYKTITIGTQTWMKENLRTTRFRNDSIIPLVTSAIKWYYLTTPGFCWYNNSEINKNTYGALYNWFAVYTGRDGNKNICPTGWHIPTDTEWTILTTYLGGENVAVGKLKETGTTHWQAPNSDAIDEIGFTALPGGGRDFDGIFSDIGSYGYWWSSTELVTGAAWCRYMGYDGSGGYSFGRFEQDGFSVRCIKNN